LLGYINRQNEPTKASKKHGILNQKRKAMKAFISALFLFNCCFYSTLFAASTEPLQTVSSVELHKYIGKWYEIARYENWFEKGCVGATAEYVLEEDMVRVINRCYDETGTKTDEANGKAYAVEGSENARLRVTFFWPFYGNYWVIKLAEDYRYAVVGEPTRKYLWVLARGKTLNDEDKQAILEALPTFGYDVTKLYWTKSDGIVF